MTATGAAPAPTPRRSVGVALAPDGADEALIDRLGEQMYGPSRGNPMSAALRIEVLKLIRTVRAHDAAAAEPLADGIRTMLGRLLGACGEDLDGGERCTKPAEFVVWGKLVAPEALGPRCYDHAAEHLGHHALASRAGWALVHLGDLARDLAQALNTRVDVVERVDALAASGASAGAAPREWWVWRLAGGWSWQVGEQPPAPHKLGAAGELFRARAMLNQNESTRGGERR